LFGEASLRRALTDFIDHFHGERNKPQEVMIRHTGRIAFAVR
jgi:hypothetical protein